MKRPGLIPSDLTLRYERQRRAERLLMVAAITVLLAGLVVVLCP